MADKRTDTATLIQAMRILARDIQSDDGVANAAIAEAADRMEQQAATIAKLPRYHDTGEAFVPGVDEAWMMTECGPRMVDRVRCPQGRFFFHSWRWTAPSAYPTAAACEEAQGWHV